MRIIAGVIFGILLAGQAQASSFVVMGTSSIEKPTSVIRAGESKSVKVIGAPKSGRSSVVAYGQATGKLDATGEPEPSSAPSIIAMGAPLAGPARTPACTVAQPNPISVSMLAMGTPAPRVEDTPMPGLKLPEIRPVSESVVAMGQPAPPVASEVVASIRPPKPKPAARMPLLIRGGLFGDEMPAPVELPAQEPTREERRKAAQKPEPEPEPEKHQPLVPLETPG